MTPGHYVLRLPVPLLAAFVMIALQSEAGALPVGNNDCPQDVGPNDWPTFLAHKDDCSKYFMCDHGKPVEVPCPTGMVFNEQHSSCVLAGGIDDTCTVLDPEKACEKGIVDFIPHPNNCHQYYNCSDATKIWGNPLGRYLKECEYPDQFDIHRKQCVPYDQAVCGPGRVAPTWQCQYSMYQCHRSHCIPCYVRYPSCLGREDGPWPHDAKEWSPYYTVCKGQRSSGEERCPRHSLTGSTQLFHREKRRCVSLWEIPKEHGGYAPSCEGKEDGYHTIEEAEIVSYQCPGTRLFYCNPPLSVQPGIGRCVPFGTLSNTNKAGSMA